MERRDAESGESASEQGPEAERPGHDLEAARALIARLERELIAARRAKANFLSVMSHELRTPLSAIIGYTDLMDRGVAGAVTDAQTSYLARIRASSNHLLQIIEEILAFAGAESGTETAEARPGTIGGIMRGVRAVAEPLSHDEAVELRIRVDDEHAELNTDGPKIRQVILNLVSNALKFTRKGSVEVRARVDAGDAVFEVADTGVGIAAHRQEEIFERFWQAEDALTRTVGGTGLGLTVGRSYAELLGGTLTVDSTEGVGSTFTLRVPRTLPA